jgi:cytochrome c oxidase subunit 2
LVAPVAPGETAAMVVPVGRPVFVQLSARDVIHSFFLPNLRIKQDAIPGMVTSIYFTPEKTGHFNIACAQHCGLGHYRMKGEFVVDSLADFAAWSDAQEKEALSATPEQWAWDWNKGLSAGGGPKRKQETPS